MAREFIWFDSYSSDIDLDELEILYSRENIQFQRIFSDLDFNGIDISHTDKILYIFRRCSEDKKDVYYTYLNVAFELIEYLNKSQYKTPSKRKTVRFNKLLNDLMGLEQNLDQDLNENKIFACMYFHSTIRNVYTYFKQTCLGENNSNLESYLLKTADIWLNGTPSKIINRITKDIRFIARIATGVYSVSNLIDQFKRYFSKNCHKVPIAPTLELKEGVLYAELAYEKSRNGQAIEIQSYIPDLLNSMWPKNKRYLEFANGFSAYVAQNNNKEYIIGYRGTEPKNICNWFTDAIQFLFGPDIVYKLALGLLITTYESVKNHTDARILVYRHSLGGGMMQFSVKALKCSRVFGFGYNSAGLSDATSVALIGVNGYRERTNIHHLYLFPDIVFPFSGKQEGQFSIECTGLNIKNLFAAHKIKTIKSVLNINDKFRLK